MDSELLSQILAEQLKREPYSYRTKKRHMHMFGLDEFEVLYDGQPVRELHTQDCRLLALITELMNTAYQVGCADTLSKVQVND